MNKESIASLREKFDNKQVITMGELDLLIKYAEQSERFIADFNAWMAACPLKRAAA